MPILSCFVRGYAPHRGISQEKHPLVFGIFEFIHNTRIHKKSVSTMSLRRFNELLNK